MLLLICILQMKKLQKRSNIKLLKVYYERRSGEFNLLEMPVNNCQGIDLHSFIRAVTCTYFQAAYMHITQP